MAHQTALIAFPAALAVLGYWMMARLPHVTGPCAVTPGPHNCYIPEPLWREPLGWMFAGLVIGVVLDALILLVRHGHRTA